MFLPKNNNTLVAKVRSRVQRSRTQAPRHDPSDVMNESVLGAEEDPRSDLPETEAGKIASIFADIIEGGDPAELADLLGDDVIYLVPGRSDAAGLHHGHEAVTQALAQQASEDTTVSIVEVTEVIAAWADAPTPGTQRPKFTLRPTQPKHSNAVRVSPGFTQACWFEFWPGDLSRFDRSSRLRIRRAARDRVRGECEGG